MSDLAERNSNADAYGYTDGNPHPKVSEQGAKGEAETYAESGANCYANCEPIICIPPLWLLPVDNGYRLTTPWLVLGRSYH